eukprot:COSAG06_NODE_2428_length_6891_cov_11.077433_5_plen_255_part_00
MLRSDPKAAWQEDHESCVLMYAVYLRADRSNVHANDQDIERAILASFASAKVEAEVVASTELAAAAAAAARSDGVLIAAHAPAATTDDTAPTPDTTPTAIAVPSSASTLAAPSAPSGAAIQAAGYVIPDGARPGIAVPTLKYADDAALISALEDEMTARMTAIEEGSLKLADMVIARQKTFYMPIAPPVAVNETTEDEVIALNLPTATTNAALSCSEMGMGGAADWIDDEKEESPTTSSSFHSDSSPSTPPPVL